MKRRIGYMLSCCLLLGVGCESDTGPLNDPSLQAADTASEESGIGYVWGPEDGEWHLIPPDEGSSIVKASPRSGVRQLAVFADKTPPFDGPTIHRHDDADEIFYLHSGAGTWTMGDSSWDVGAGATVFVPRGTWHTYRTTAESTEMIYVMSSPGLEEYLRIVSGVVGGPPAQPVTKELAQRYLTTSCYQNGLVPCSMRKAQVEGYVLERDEGEAFLPDDAGRRTIIKASPETGSPSTLMFTQDIPRGANALSRRNFEAEEILYIDQGTGMATLDGFRFVVMPGSIIFAPPGVLHSIENPSEALRVVGFASRPGLERDFRSTLSGVGEGSAMFTPEQLQDIRQKHETTAQRRDWRR